MTSHTPPLSACVTEAGHYPVRTQAELDHAAARVELLPVGHPWRVRLVDLGLKAGLSVPAQFSTEMTAAGGMTREVISSLSATANGRAALERMDIHVAAPGSPESLVTFGRSSTSGDPEDRELYRNLAMTQTGRAYLADRGISPESL